VSGEWLSRFGPRHCGQSDGERPDGADVPAVGAAPATARPKVAATRGTIVLR